MSPSEPSHQQAESVDILIIHGLVVTMDEALTVIEDGAVAISGGAIAATGPTAELASQYKAAETIAAASHIVMPGLISAHTHCPAVMFRGLVEDLTLYDWLDKMWRIEKQFIDPQTIRIGANLAYAELIRGGATTAMDMYWHAEVSIEAARQAGYRLLTGGGFMVTNNPPDGIATDDRAAIARGMLEKYRDDPLITPIVRPHSTYTVPPDLLQLAKALADEYGAIFHTHASESQGEVADVLDRYGNTPVNHLDSLGLLDERTVLAHCVHLSDQEIDLMARRGAIPVHNPLANLKLGSGVARIPEMLQAGIPVLLGVDGPQCGNDLDMWWAMRLAAVLQKGYHRDAALMPAAQVVKMATNEAGKRLGLKVGSLEAGQIADLILVDLHSPHLTPLYDVYAHLVYAVGREDVTTTIINGRVVMRDRRLLTMDEEEVIAEAAELGRKIAAAASIG